nr:hypothetical protein B0A51_02759 [Rachicladosporium sp. CCFEE 5018]
MSDATAEPGAPVDTTKPIPQASEKSVSSEVQKKAPGLVKYAQTPDKVILRFNKLISTPGGLNSFLSTFNYTLYLVAYLESKSIPLQTRLFSLLGRSGPSPATLAAPSHIGALGTLLSSTRTTLRLFGLFPLYAWMRTLLQGPKQGQDPVLYATALTQCTFYILFQGLENIGLLTDHKVLSPATTARWNQSGTTARIYTWSYRAWLAGVLCDFVRLGREAQLERIKRSSSEVSTTEQEKTDAKWWSELIVPFAWLPVALQFAGVKEGGLPGFNLGIMGACGAMAGLSKTTALWESTA